MKNRRLEKRFICAVIIGSVANIITLVLWLIFRINPIIPKIETLKSEIFNNEIEEKYDSYEDMLIDINMAAKKHNLIINIEDTSGMTLTDNKIKIDAPLITKMVETTDDTYLIKIYFDNHSNISRAILELVFIQIIVVTIILFITFIYTRQIVLKPINTLIDDIRNYKFGKKPKKRPLNTEFDLIANEFADLTDRLDEEKAEQTRIIASISHDIKTPLTSIIGYSNLLKDQSLSEESKKYNEKINEKAINIKDILATFDDYLLNQEKIELKPTLVQVKDIVNELNNDYKIELDNNNITFTVTTNIPEEYLNVDTLKIKRIFSNMISNSARYLKNGGKILINISSYEEYIKFIVKDNGPGVSEKIIDKIFDPLFTTDNSRKISGLGLSICKEFIEMHGGTLKAYNDHGLTLEFLIPKYKNEKNKAKN